MDTSDDGSRPRRTRPAAGDHDDRDDRTVDGTDFVSSPAGSGGSNDEDFAHQPASERFLLGETLGEGGMAIIHLATDTHLDRLVAVKRMRAELEAVTEARQRFVTEARILARLDHPGTTPVFEAGRLPDGNLFYAMKRVRGHTLRELLDKRDSHDLRDRGSMAHLIEIFIRACQAVASAHDQGVIHRDIKPSNIMVDDLGVVYVMDWGLAKELTADQAENQTDSSLTRVGAVMGSPAYMSPEQASGHADTSDRQADVFSLGVMLYEILTGVNPFKGTTALESMKGVMYHRPDAPRGRNRHVNRVISEICLKAIDKDPFRRYRSARELAEDVRCYREFLPVSAVKPTVGERVTNWVRRYPRIAAAATTLLVVLTIIAAEIIVQASIERTRIAEGFEVIESLDQRLAEIEAERQTLRARAAAGVPVDRATGDRLAALDAELETAIDERKSIAVAITGFTLFAPNPRATSIVRESIFASIAMHVELEEYYRARTEIQAALGYADRGNIYGFSADDRARLENDLAVVRGEIAKRAMGGSPTAEPRTTPDAIGSAPSTDRREPDHLIERKDRT